MIFLKERDMNTAESVARALGHSSVRVTTEHRRPRPIRFASDWEDVTFYLPGPPPPDALVLADFVSPAPSPEVTGCNAYSTP